MTILCIDAGFRNMGLAVYNTASGRFIHTECVQTQKQDGPVSADCVRSLRIQTSRLMAVCEKFNVELVLAELPTGASRSSRAVRAMAMAFAMVVTFCKSVRIPLKEIRPNEIKRLVSDRGAVSKDSVIDHVSRVARNRHLLKVYNRSQREHVADAMAIMEVYQHRLP